MGKFSPLIREDGEKKKRGGGGVGMAEWNLTEERHGTVMRADNLLSAWGGFTFPPLSRCYEVVRENSRLRRSTECETVHRIPLRSRRLLSVDKQI